MKWATLFMVSCVLMFFVMNNINEVESIHVEQAGVCEFTGEFPGKCGNNGRKMCVEAMNKKNKGSPGENKKNLRCECFDNPVVILGRPKRICRCRNNC
uniref:Putative defensin-like protein 227 n=1 Tax=Arabidopsis thaliana TaxID=3702 RepID=DF227_ARATH|nr:RecName: Full=Putative defensin-like protein 227; AltName: Full=Putative S locus cysteine-rich-like protein 28; Short=Protein SCRL28; Short=SCR-like protein 28; Flags: Precursor [Arabidopsis thaliana]